MTSSDSSNSTINALLRAEKEAKGVVETARGERKQQLKRAQMEANDHIIALKEQAQQEVRPHHRYLTDNTHISSSLLRILLK